MTNKDMEDGSETDTYPSEEFGRVYYFRNAIPSNTFKTPQFKSPAYLMALNEWKGFTNVDVFLDQAYKYYQGKGIEILFINNFANWIAMGFVVMFTACLRYCIDWERVLRGPVNERDHPQLWKVFRPFRLWRMSWTGFLAMIVLMVLWCWQFSWLMNQFPEWRRMRRFYTDLLGIPDHALATCDFADITSRIVALQGEHPISNYRLGCSEHCQ